MNAAARRRLLGRLGLVLAGGLAAALAPSLALATGGVTLRTLEVRRGDQGLLLDFVVTLQLPKAVDDALQRGVPIYFEAEASTYRPRWYWRDERVARVRRAWRLSYQPLTSSWRVSLGGLNQPYATLADALAGISRLAQWEVAAPGQLEAGEPYYVEFSYKLDTTRLPGPMQIGIGGQAEWSLQAEHTIRVP